jgi:hypothetical protein
MQPEYIYSEQNFETKRNSGEPYERYESNMYYFEISLFIYN